MPLSWKHVIFCRSKSSMRFDPNTELSKFFGDLCCQSSRAFGHLGFPLSIRLAGSMQGCRREIHDPAGSSYASKHTNKVEEGKCSTHRLYPYPAG